MNHPNLSHVKRGGATVIRRAVALMVASFNGLGSPASAADITLAEPLCGELKKERPEVRNFAPVGAHALLVIAIANVFNFDGKKLA